MGFFFFAYCCVMRVVVGSVLVSFSLIGGVDGLHGEAVCVCVCVNWHPLFEEQHGVCEE